MMPIYQVVILALVQAATEFLPISSTAHLVVIPWLLGWNDPGLDFSIALHLGTLIAVLSYFSKTWLRLISLSLGRKALIPSVGEQDHDLYDNPRLFWFLVAATVPAGIAGLLFEDHIEGAFRSPIVIGVMLIAGGLLIGLADRQKRLLKNLGNVSFAHSMIIGCAQVLALIPGTSRSGVTIAAAMFLGVERPSAARFSFLLSSPIILGASLKAVYDLSVEGGIVSQMQVPFLVGITVSAATGYAVIALFVSYLQRRTMKIFVYYRVISGIIILALASFLGSSLAD